MVFSLAFPVSPLFNSGLDELLFVLIFFLWYYFEIINQVFVAIKNKNSLITIKKDKLSLLFIYLATFAILYESSFFGMMRLNYGLAALPFWAFYVGISLMMLGELLREWCIYTLGRFFTFPVVIMKDHKLIKKGPYKILRHPSYLGGTITFIGVGLVMQSWIAPIVAALIMLAVYSYRIYFEEKALIKRFGKEYENYMKSTYRLIPYVF